MRYRCTKPDYQGFSIYGGRGITICKRWMKFENFLADMGERPPNKTIDRIDNDGNYEPGNCRWATRKEQNENRRSVRWIEWRGERLRASQWAERLGIKHVTIQSRFARGWTIEKILTYPVVSPVRRMTFDGKTLSQAEWAKLTGMCTVTLWRRLARGWPIEKVLSVPRLSPGQNYSHA